MINLCELLLKDDKSKKNSKQVKIFFSNSRKVNIYYCAAILIIKPRSLKIHCMRKLRHHSLFYL
jgi:hypothetical protein